MSGSQRPNVVANPYASGGARTQILNPAAFAIAAPGTFGNAGAFAFHQPPFANWDVSVQKAFPIGESVRASLRAELYNFPNHFSFTTISSTVGSSNFGQATAATDPRTLQLALKVSF